LRSIASVYLPARRIWLRSRLDAAALEVLEVERDVRGDGHPERFGEAAAV
jgi:hypothetical protein